MTQTMIAERLASCGIPSDACLAEKLLQYHELLLEWNARMDLTAILDEDEMLDRHYIDSLIPLSFPSPLSQATSVIDVGTGAGFPGIPLALALPDVQFTLLDARQKRLDFLHAVQDALNIRNVNLLHARAEDAASRPDLRAQFDCAIARAVAPLNVLSEYLLPFVRIGGYALCWKGPSYLSELDDARKAVHLLGGHFDTAVPCPIPGRDWQHVLVTISKTTATARRYPRKAGMPSKQPLGSTPLATGKGT